MSLIPCGTICQNWKHLMEPKHILAEQMYTSFDDKVLYGFAKLKSLWKMLRNSAAPLKL